MSYLEITWVRLKRDPRCHDQWDAVDVNALVRKIGDEITPQYEAFLNGKRVGSTFPTLRKAKNAVENRI